MDLRLTAEQKMIQDMVRKFASNELEPLAQDADQNQRHPSQSLKQMAELGLLGMTIPADYDGSEMDSISLSIVIEEISRACASSASVLIAHTALASYPIFKYGNDQQKKRYLPKLAVGDSMGASTLGDSESAPNTISDECVAVPEAEDYLLNGKKSFVMNGENADLYLVLARQGDQKLCFITERGPGLTVNKLDYLVGMRASGTCELTLSECRVSNRNILGKDTDALARDTLNLARLLIGAQALGIGQACLESALKYAKERHQFGRPICRFEMVQGMLAAMATRLSAAKALVTRAALERDFDQDFSQQAAMAKWYASETASFAAKTAVQIYGGYGYTKDFPVERYMRDAKVTEICGDTSAIQKMAVAKSLLE